VRDASALDAVFSAYRFDAVMHFAALAYVGESVTAPGRYYDVNVHGTRTLLDAMVRAGVRSIIFSSSCAIYGEPDSMPIGEHTGPNPINPYGFSKLVCERMMDDFGRVHDPETHLIPLVLDAASGRRADVTVFGTDYPTPDGTAVRDYIHVNDLARAHVLALDHLLHNGDTVAVYPGSWYGTAGGQGGDTARGVPGRGIVGRDTSRRAGDPPVLVADPRKASEVLRWTLRHSDLAAIITDAWRWHNKRFCSKGL